MSSPSLKSLKTGLLKTLSNLMHLQSSPSWSRFGMGYCSSTPSLSFSATVLWCLLTAYSTQWGVLLPTTPWTCSLFQLQRKQLEHIPDPLHSEDTTYTIILIYDSLFMHNSFMVSLWLNKHGINVYSHWDTTVWLRIIITGNNNELYSVWRK